MANMDLNTKHKATITDAATRLTGYDRRAFQAQVTLDYLEGSARKAENIFGWNRNTVKLGLNELTTGIRCLENFGARGNKRTEEKEVRLEANIRSLAEPESQTDPKFQSPFQYTRMTAKAMRQALITQHGWLSEELPTENTIGNIMNRLGYKLRRVQKRNPLKRIKQTDEIFNKVKEVNETADKKEDVCRISIDTKAKVAVGDYSRRGVSRGLKSVEALDHDTQCKKNGAVWHPRNEN